MWKEHVIECQDLLDLNGLRFSEGEFFRRAWGNYMKLAKEMWAELEKDCALKQTT